MASPSSMNLFGWDLLYKTVESSVNKKPDVLIALVHFILIKVTGFRCIGVGEDKTFSNDEEGSELLPDGWNESEDKYALRYLFDKQLFILLATKTENIYIINLLDVKTKNVSNIGLDAEELVKSTKGSLKQMIPTASDIMDRFRRELVDPVFSGSTKEVTTQTAIVPQTSHDPLRINRPRSQFETPNPSYLGYSDPTSLDPLRNVGRGDLDPLGRGGPGNLLEFPRRPLPGGGLPRFDPYGPPGRGLPPNPNPDHFQPPGGFDSYYN